MPPVFDHPVAEPRGAAGGRSSNIIIISVRRERPSSGVRPKAEYRLNEIAEAPSRLERVGLIAQRASRTRIRRERG
jgi:hypothetical protein